jgi:hypothetical protein
MPLHALRKRLGGTAATEETDAVAHREADAESLPHGQSEGHPTANRASPAPTRVTERSGGRSASASPWRVRCTRNTFSVRWWFPLLQRLARTRVRGGRGSKHRRQPAQLHEWTAHPDHLLRRTRATPRTGWVFTRPARFPGPREESARPAQPRSDAVDVSETDRTAFRDSSPANNVGRL